MSTSIKQKTNDYLLRLAKSSQSLESFRYSIIIALVVCFGALPHVAFWFYFLMIGYWPMVLVNTCSLLVFGVAFLFSRQKKHDLTALLVTIEAVLYAIISVLVFGYDAFFQWYILLIVIPQLLFVHSSSLQRFLLTALPLVVFLGLFVADHYFTMGSFLEESFCLRFINLSFVVIGIVFELLLSQLVRRVTDRISFENMEELKNQSHLDPLTGLYNRRFAEMQFNEILLRTNGPAQTPYCFAMIDIDDFKNVNDQFGHAAGDIVLKEIGQLFVEHLRKTDLVVRWGGEEFLVVLAGVETQRAKAILEGLRTQVAKKVFCFESLALTCTVTIGVSQLHDNIQQTITACDKNMYAGKSSGKNKVVV